ncbi:MAG: hypothetical protein ACE5KM_10335, partial [Planctomycetaceae bacterium]
RVAVTGGKLKDGSPAVSRDRDGVELRFRRVADVGSLLHPVGTPSPVQVVLTYADGNTLRVHFRAAKRRPIISGKSSVGAPTMMRTGRRSEYVVTAIDVGKTRIALEK